MKSPLSRLAVAAIVTAGVAPIVGCYPAYPPPYTSAYGQDAKGYSVPYEPAPPQPERYGVDPGVVIAGAAAVGLLGYAIGNNHHHPYPYYYGPGYYRPVPYGYWGGHYRRGYHR